MRTVAALATAIAVASLVRMIVGPVSVRRPPVWSRRLRRRGDWLVGSGVGVSPTRFWLASAGAGLATFALGLLLTGVWVVALPPALFVSTVPRLYYARLAERRRAELQQAWPDGLRDLIASISAGMSLRRAIEQLAATGPEALRTAFARFPSLASTVGVGAALERIRQEVGDPTTDRVIEVLIIAHEWGGPLVPQILRDLASATTRDLWTMEEVRTASLEQRINARVVFVLPWLVLVALTLQDGGYRAFYRSPAGMLVVAVGGILSLAGMVMVARLGRQPSEPRVLASPGEEPS